MGLDNHPEFSVIVCRAASFVRWTTCRTNLISPLSFVYCVPRCLTLIVIAKHLLLAQAAAENQKRGKPGQFVDSRPTFVDGELKIVITNQSVHDIFEKFPIVARAYSDSVLAQVTHICGSYARCMTDPRKAVGGRVLKRLLSAQAL